MTQVQDIWAYNRDKVSHLSSVVQQERASRTSDRYSLIPTTRVIDTLGERGWMVRSAKETRSREARLVGFQKHLITFRNPEVGAVGDKDSVFPEIVLTNSHDGLASFNLMAGLFRVVCSNGLVVADSMFAKFSIRHVGYTDSQVHAAVDHLLRTLPQISSRVAEWQAITLTPDEQRAFGIAAVEYRYNGDPERVQKIDLGTLVKPIRGSDNDNTLWNTYNRVQEKLVNGHRMELNGRPVRSWSTRHLDKTRGINGITESVRLNRALWTLAENMAKLKKGETIEVDGQDRESYTDTQDRQNYSQ